MMNRQWVLSARPEPGMPLEACFTEQSASVAALAPGEVLLRNRAISVEPGMVAWMHNMAYYMAPMNIGDPMHSWNVAEVVESRNPRYAVGQRVHGVFGWQEYCVCGDLDRNHTRLFPVPEGASDEVASSLLWVSGITAYLGLMDCGRPRPGDSVLVTAAAGSVGTTVGQLAKLAGARVVGLAGSDEKCRWLEETLGFDLALNYRRPDLAAALADAFPDGVDIYWDTVGGAQLDQVLGLMAVHGRVVQIGALSITTDFAGFTPLNNWVMPLHKRLQWQGFIVTDHWDRFDATIERLHQLHRQGALTAVVDAERGFERLPGALTRLLAGENLGKKVVLID